MKKSLIILAISVMTLSACQRDKIAVYRAPKEAPSASMPMMGMGSGMPSSAGDSGTNIPMDSGAAPMGGGMASGELPPGHPSVDGNSSPQGQLPPGHPPIDGSASSSGAPMMGNNMMGGGMGMSGPVSRGVTYTAPKGWTEKPPSQMRVASFSATGKNGQTVDISVVSLSGEAGGDLSNVNRWRGQIELGPITETDLPKQTKKISPAGREMLLADMVGDKPVIDNKFKRRLTAVIYFHGGQSWFFKMIGEDSAVTENKPALMKFLESLKFANE